MENINFEEIISKGAIIIDVRTKKEFEEGHVKGVLNIPLDEIAKNTDWLLKDAPIIVCCASGSRSKMAKLILNNNGFKEVYNGGICNELGNLKGIGSCKVK
jgi:phage shock protein E